MWINLKNLIGKDSSRLISSSKILNGYLYYKFNYTTYFIDPENINHYGCNYSQIYSKYKEEINRYNFYLICG